jgi:hypothetical protein
LCWTEYYNGKWQPTKTSDVSLPTTFGTFDQTGPGSFEAIRDSLVMIPAQFTGTNPHLQNYASYDFSIPPDALILPIAIDALDLEDGPNSGFILHNTSSLPVRFDDISVLVTYSPPGSPVTTETWRLIDIIDPRAFQFFKPSIQPYIDTPYLGNYESGTFIVTFGDGSGSTVYSADILEFHWQPRYTSCWGVGSPDQWTAPFFYEDRRNLFYVTTTQSIAPVSATQSFGLPAATRVPLAPKDTIPPLGLLPAPITYHGRVISRTGSTSNGKGQ